MRDLLECGELVNDNGKIIPRPRFHENGCHPPR
jgi:hypothetical protein